MNKGKPSQKTRIPAENNAGERRQPLTVTKIMKNDRFYFRSKFVHKIFADYPVDMTYDEFISHYLDIQRAAVTNRKYTPSKVEMKALEAYTRKEINMWEFGKILNLTDRTRITLKIGRLYAYKMENS